MQSIRPPFAGAGKFNLPLLMHNNGSPIQFYRIWLISFFGKTAIVFWPSWLRRCGWAR
jgi:hypothetical protein